MKSAINPFPRSCGSCNVCCTALGLEELKKHPNTPCQHLKTNHYGSRECCSIYEKRPLACARFHCAWIEGLGPELIGRPDRSGLMTVIYPGRNDPDDKTNLSAVITIVDSRRSGGLNEPDSQLYKLTIDVLRLGFDNIKIINRKTGGVIYIQEKLAYAGKLLPGDTYEDLRFECYEPPIGKVETQGEIGDTSNAQ